MNIVASTKETKSHFTERFKVCESYELSTHRIYGHNQIQTDLSVKKLMNNIH